MPMRPLHAILRKVRRTLLPERSGGVSDGELLTRFLAERDEAAFELLVWRHGPMVLGVCRRVLRDVHAAEDAFQATFFTLARKGSSLGRRDSVGGWLYTVAHRIALRARTRQARRAVYEQPLGDFIPPATGAEPGADLAWRELASLLDTEVDRLPEKYRTAFVLCYLEGKTNEEAAELLGCPKGTILSRLARARERLRGRLSSRGVVLGAAPFALFLARNASNLLEVSPVLVQATVHGSLLVSLGKVAGGSLASTAVALMEDFLHEPSGVRLKVVLAGLALLALVGTGTGAVAYGWRPAPDAAPAQDVAPPPACSSAHGPPSGAAEPAKAPSVGRRSQ
jgi:RNA polymerase sigma factor (sigma-70 family)